MVADRAAFRHRLFSNKRFEPTSSMQGYKGILAPAQGWIEDFKRIFQDRMRRIVHDGLLSLIAQEVTDFAYLSRKKMPGRRRFLWTERGNPVFTLQMNPCQPLPHQSAQNRARDIPPGLRKSCCPPPFQSTHRSELVG